MPIKKWLIQYVIAIPIAGLLLMAVQLLKGRDIDYAIEFGLLWGIISASIFLGSRIYYFKKGLYCKVCADLPEPGTSPYGNKPE